jgi:hypothetical protein
MAKDPLSPSKICYGGFSGSTKIEIWQQHFTFQFLDDDNDNHEDYRYRLIC